MVRRKLFNRGMSILNIHWGIDRVSNQLAVHDFHMEIEVTVRSSWGWKRPNFTGVVIGDSRDLEPSWYRVSTLTLAFNATCQRARAIVVGAGRRRHSHGCAPLSLRPHHPPHPSPALPQIHTRTIPVMINHARNKRVIKFESIISAWWCEVPTYLHTYLMNRINWRFLVWPSISIIHTWKSSSAYVRAHMHSRNPIEVWKILYIYFILIFID